MDFSRKLLAQNKIKHFQGPLSMCVYFPKLSRALFFHFSDSQTFKDFKDPWEPCYITAFPAVIRARLHG